MLLEGSKTCRVCGDKGGTCVDRISIFDFLSPDEKSMVLSKSIHKFYRKGEVIFSPGEAGSNLYIINHGEVKISKFSSAGKEQILHILKEGDFLGEHSLFGNETLKNYAEAMRNTALCMIRGDDLKALILLHPEMGLKFLEKYAKKNLEALDLVESIGLYDAGQRLAKYILDEADRTGSNDITLRYSKGILSNLIGTSQETLSRRLTTMQDSGIIRLEGQRGITVLDREALENML
jgi:CRP/FNR family transcriptional regulator